jgi:hypothetical protein
VLNLHLPKLRLDIPPSTVVCNSVSLRSVNIHSKALIVNAVAELCEVYVHGLDM